MSKKFRRHSSTEERHLRRLLELAPDAMVVVDQAGVIVLANSQAKALFGYQPEEMLGSHVEVLIPKRFRETHRGHRISFFSEPRVRPMGAKLQLFALRKNGTEFPVEISLSPVETAEGMLVVSAIRDVSERKLAEESLRESEERLRLAQRAAGIGSFEWNVQTSAESWTPELEAMYGLPPGGFGGTHSGWTNLIHEDDLPEVQRLVDEALKTGRPMTGEWRVVWPDGSVHWIAGRWQVFMDEYGKPLRVLGVNINVTERKRAEEAVLEMNRTLEAQSVSLKSSEEMLKIFVKNVPAAVAMLDREMRYLQVSDRWRTDYLSGREDVVGRSHYEIFPDMPERWKEIHRRALAGETLRADEDHWVGQDGPHWARWEARPWKTPQSPVGGILILAEDITRRKKMEQAVHEGEERLRLAAQAGKMFAYSWDAATDVIARSGESFEILGVKSDQAATGTAISAMVHPDDKERLDFALAKLTPENPELKITYRIIRPDGSVRWLQRNSLAYFGEHARLQRIVGMIADVTDRKQAKEKLAEMTRKLIEAQEKERARIGRELHDDINQRLAMLAMELEQPQDASEFQNRMQGFRNELRQISDDVQALSHDLHSSKLEYLGVVAGIKSWCKEFAERQKMDVEFKSDVRTALPLDVGRPLFRVLQEALHNAVKHSGVKRIEVELHEEAGEIHLTIKDLGKGFDIEAARQGRGLGLTSMQERVRLVNGAIEIQSKPMGGTTIHVRVPIDPEQGAQREAV